MQKLTKEYNLFSDKLFGKILGLNADYYVVEAPNEDPEGEKNEEDE